MHFSVVAAKLVELFSNDSRSEIYFVRFGVGSTGLPPIQQQQVAAKHSSDFRFAGQLPLVTPIASVSMVTPIASVSNTTTTAPAGRDDHDWSDELLKQVLIASCVVFAFVVVLVITYKVGWRSRRVWRENKTIASWVCSVTRLRLWRVAWAALGDCVVTPLIFSYPLVKRICQAGLTSPLSVIYTVSIKSGYVVKKTQSRVQSFSST